MEQRRAPVDVSPHLWHLAWRWKRRRRQRLPRQGRFESRHPAGQLFLDLAAATAAGRGSVGGSRGAARIASDGLQPKRRLTGHGLAVSHGETPLDPQSMLATYTSRRAELAPTKTTCLRPGYLGKFTLKGWHRPRALVVVEELTDDGKEYRIHFLPRVRIPSRIIPKLRIGCTGCGQGTETGRASRVLPWRAARPLAFPDPGSVMLLNATGFRRTCRRHSRFVEERIGSPSWTDGCRYAAKFDSFIESLRIRRTGFSPPD
ncbi:hypothetical protein CDD80_6803 [Ophiocordyceps camponoti-rufipedis]|uniref:Uncharacterized protein n=1 Tax=Ophiocordyceps camponoti-rufipedis TaxID=2004952 RepID=A0A2C5ZF84_9HYPO|nr:hypothetical protein CDD80_6803 [Ophiocordyceps camponoti-rufipedis]